MNRVYLDHAATAPLRPEALAAMQPWLTQGFGNANTLYKEGKQARQALDEARATVAALIGASPLELVFTSGGTEADNAAIAGITQAIRATKGREKGGNHLVCSAFEHHAVLEPMQALKRSGYTVSQVKPSRDGFINPEALSQALRPDTLLASIILAQNEIGTVQPLLELSHIAHANGTLLHTDAVQALGKLSLDVRELGVDAASFSAHKLGGPKGVGAFYLKSGTPFAAIQLGGGQEAGRRSGTQDVAGAVGFAKALELAVAEREQEAHRLTALRDHLAAELLALDPRISLTVGNVTGGTDVTKGTVPFVITGGTDVTKGTVPFVPFVTSPCLLPGMLSILVDGFESETLILRLDDAGFAVSGGSACSTGSLAPSHVLLALGLTRDQAYSVLRISLGRENTSEDIARFLSSLESILKA
ncbi:MAG: cysteine desulfurase [Coriobacteriia bacterium]|nr:cysteine desulfurase [Coriobacteriia bacterium]